MELAAWFDRGSEWYRNVGAEVVTAVIAYSGPLEGMELTFANGAIGWVTFGKQVLHAVIKGKEVWLDEKYHSRRTAGPADLWVWDSDVNPTTGLKVDSNALYTLVKS